MSANSSQFSSIRVCVLFAALAMLVPSLHAQTATQEVSLVTGWNAVWLEVEPQDAAGIALPPTTVFDTATNTAITVIASPKPLTGLAEFFGDDPGTESGTFNQDGWEQWLKVDPAGDSDLMMITGNRGYLIKSTANLTIEITGKTRFFRPTWTPDRYNLVGFGIEGTIPFDKFFTPSAGKHPLNRIYGLAPNGDWSLVTPGSPIQDGVAYWIFSSGPSDYMGPVAVSFDLAASGTLNFGGPTDAVQVAAGSNTLILDLKELVFTNLGDDEATPSADEATPSLDLITAASGGGTLDLHVVTPASGTLGYDHSNPVDSSAGPGTGVGTDLGEAVATETTSVLTLGAQRNWTAGTAGRTNLYRLTPATPGPTFWLPVSATRNSIQLPTDILPVSDADTVAGLWVGEVTIDAITSIVEDGAPVQPSAAAAPLRLLLHSDGAGTVQLLSQVTVMQTKTADPDVAPTPVLVVDQARIPFFEGIKERNGKRVGLRLEAVAYDMPRKLDAASQAALLDDEAYPDLQEAGIEDFLISSAIRPPTLTESYHLSWPMTGAIGSGKTLRTSDPLSLDPFHRSNPFRHAFHKNLAKGPNITRSIQIVFDPDQSIADRLSGTFTDTLQGLTKTDIQLTGRIEMRRVSPVAVLDTAP
jgi:hypothetical protein